MKNASYKLSIVSFLAFMILFFMTDTINAQTNTSQELVYISVEIKGLACPFCAFGMEKELKTISGVDSVHIELKKGLAFITTQIKQQPTREGLEKIIIDAGFTPGKIEYSDIPFLNKE